MASDDKLYDLVIEWDQRRQQGEELPAAALCTDCPELIPALEERIASVKATDWLLDDDDEDADFLSLPPELTRKSFSVPESVSLDQFSQSIVTSGVLTSEELQQVETVSANDLAGKLIRSNRLTEYQAKLIAEGNTKGLVLGNYVILDKIGAGGMGQVFKARHKRMKRVVALKTLPDKAIESATALERFHREVEAAARLEHPNIVTAFDADEFDGQHFLVMQFVDGDDLSSLVRKKGTMSVGHAVDCITQAAKGLEYAHGEGVISRDVKPGNILLDKRGVVKVLDMGLARMERTNGSNGFAITESELTTGGVVLGTVDYLAPEQALDTHSADGRSDIYSLGCTLYFLLTGKPVYSGSTLMAKMLAHREKEIPSLRDQRDDVPDRLEAIYEKMIAKKPEDRYATMTALLEDLESVATECEDTWKGDKATVVDEPPSDLASRETSSSESSDTVVMPPAVEPKETPQVVAESSGSGRRLFAGVLGVLLLAGFGYWLFGILFSVETPDGIIQIESNVTDFEVFVDKEKVVYLTDPKDKGKVKVEVKPGAKLLTVSKDGFEAEVAEFQLKTVEGPIKVTFVPVKERIPVADADIHRQVAQWVLKVGGWVVLDDGNSYEPDADELPAEAFHIEKIYLMQETDALQGSGIQALARLDSLFALCVNDNPHFTDDTLMGVQFPPIASFFAEGTSLTDRGIQHLPLRDLYTTNLRETHITNESLEYLSTAPKLVQLDVANTAITDVGLAHFADHPLNNLDVTGCAGITDKSLEHIRDWPKAIVDMYLANTGVSDAGLVHLENIGVRNLDLSGTKVTKAGVLKFQQACPSAFVTTDWANEPDRKVAHWVVACGGTVIAQLMPGSPYSRSLQTLEDIPEEEFRVIGFSLHNPACDHAHVDDLAHLRRLDLSGTQIPPSRIKDAPSLTALTLNDNSFAKGSHLATLEEHQNLTFLELRNTPITNEDAETLKELKNLRYLDVTDTKLSASVVKSLQEALPNCLVVSRFNPASQNPDRRVAHWMLGLGGFVEIGVRNEKGGWIGSLRFLMQQDNVPSEAFALKRVGFNPLVLDQSGFQVPVFDGDEEHLGGLRLSLLDLRSTAATDGMLEQMSNYPISQLILDDTAITNAGLEYVSRMETLEVLAIGYCPGVTDVGMEHLADTKLKHLDVERTGITDAGLDHLCRISTLNHLDLSQTNITDAGLESIAKLEALSTLILQMNAISDLGLPHLGGLKKLTYLDLRNTKVSKRDAVERLLKEIPSIEQILLNNTALANDHDSLSMLQRIRPDCLISAAYGHPRPDLTPAFWTLRLGGNLEIGGDGKPVSINDVKAVPPEGFQVESINFNDNEFINDACAKRFKDIEGLKRLSLRNTNLTDAAVSELGRLAELEEMDLTGTKITAEGIEAIKKALPNCKIEWDGSAAAEPAQKE